MMNEDIKFIVSEVNKLLGRNYNLISFDALNSEDILQVLSDVLSEIQQQGGPRVDVRTEAPEQSSIRIFSALRVLKYQPGGDAALFRQGLVKGDPETVRAVLKWLLFNIEIVRQRAYLARFLVKVEIPQEHLGDPEVVGLYDRYTRLVDEFTIAHKEREAGKKGGEVAAELKADLEAMEKERTVITGRVERMKSRAEGAPQFLQAARRLRIERDRERELAIQRDQQREAIASLKVSLQRAEREVQTIKQAGAGLTPQALIQKLSEEVAVQTAVTRERLPAELAMMKTQVDALALVAGSPRVGPDDIIVLRNRLDVAAREVQALAEKKVETSGGVDKMAPFRQQAAAVAGMKCSTLDRLDRAKASLEELAARLEEKRVEGRRSADEPAPRGEDLKRYVARLRTRSTLYKRHRAELAGLRAEGGVLNRTLRILEAQLARMKPCNDLMPIRVAIALPDGCTAESAAMINSKLTSNISAFRAQLAPLLNELRPMREKIQDLEERFERAHRSYSTIESSMESSTANLSSEVNSMREQFKKDTEEMKRLRDEVSKLKLAEERIQQEIRRYATPGVGSTLREELNEALLAEQKKLMVLSEDEERAKVQAIQSESQTRQWNSLIVVFECKLQCAEDSKRRDGVVVRGQGAETLILQ